MARISSLASSELVKLPCPYCGRRVAAATQWLTAAHDQWGRCGVKLTHADQVIGILAWAPAERSGQAMVKALWVRPDLVGHGYGRQLVQGAAAEMLRLKLDVLLASGGTSQLTCATPPVWFLREVGFVRPIDSRLWRLDLGQAVLERSGLGFFGRVLRGFGFGPQPAPGAASRRSS